MRDIHQPPAPAWWPPAPGWWLLALALLAVALALLAWRWRARARRRRLGALYDDAVAAAATPAAQVAAVSELLRRAARRRDPRAATLDGEDWLRFAGAPGGRLPGLPAAAAGLLRDGAYRRDVAAADAAALCEAARPVFLAWSLQR
nr:DUF4381 family protein [Luteimonas sp. Y-2-2-4F]